MGGEASACKVGEYTVKVESEVWSVSKLLQALRDLIKKDIPKNTQNLHLALNEGGEHIIFRITDDWGEQVRVCVLVWVCCGLIVRVLIMCFVRFDLMCWRFI